MVYYSSLCCVVTFQCLRPFPAGFLHMPVFHLFISPSVFTVSLSFPLSFCRFICFVLGFTVFAPHVLPWFVLNLVLHYL